MAGETDPEIRRKELGARLRQLRLERELTIEDVAKHLMCSPSKVSRLESGLRSPGMRDVRDLLALYEIDGTAEGDDLWSYVQEARRRPHWEGYEDPAGAEFVALEQVASTITVYSSSLIPVLFQTQAYGRAQLRGTFPRATEEAVEQTLHTRASRKGIVAKQDSVQVLAIMDEAALHRNVGGATVMCEQLAELARICRLPNATVLVIPFSAGAHPGVETNFVLLTFADKPILGDVAVTETLTGSSMLKREKNLQRYRDALTYLRQSAYSQQDTTRLIAQVTRSFTDRTVPETFI